MRLLTTLIMLCLPMAAMGEAYVCITEHHNTLDAGGSMEVENSSLKFVLDTDKGHRMLDSSQDYEGRCQWIENNGEYFLHCSSHDQALGRLEEFIMDLENRNFSSTYQNYGLGGRYSVSLWGQCSEL